MKTIISALGAAALASCGLFGQAAAPPPQTAPSPILAPMPAQAVGSPQRSASELRPAPTATPAVVTAPAALQTDRATQIAAGPPAFEVASIKPSDLNLHGPPFRIGPNSFATRGSLKFLIQQAYEVRYYQVEGGTAWTQSESYDVHAEAETASSSHQIRVMLQALLADRFKLTLHRETRTMPGYVMSVDKRGPKLPPAKSDAPPDSPGVIQMGGGEMWARGATMYSLATAVGLELGRPVVDEAKIAGNYDFKIRFEEVDDEMSAKPADASGAADPAATGSIFTALREVGLRLDSRKVPIEVFVIDSAERPSEN